MNDEITISLLGTLVIILFVSKLLAEVAGRLGQPTVLGELTAGIILGVGVFHLVDPTSGIIVFMADVGAILLLFEIGLAIDLHELLCAGWQSLTVASIGLVLPFLGGYCVALAFGYEGYVPIFIGAALTTTGVTVVAHVMKELGVLNTKEAMIILGAGIIDDIIGIVALAVIRDLVTVGDIRLAKVFQVVALSIGFFALSLVLGKCFAHRLITVIEKMRVRGAQIVSVVSFSILWSIAAVYTGTALFIGAFAAGLMAGRTHKFNAIFTELKPLTDIFAPILFVKVGASVNLQYLNPFTAGHHGVIVFVVVLFTSAMLGKMAAGFAAFGWGVNRFAVGVGMAPRGVVGLIFVDIAHLAGLVSEEVFAAVVVVMALTTFAAVPLLKVSFRSAEIRIAPPLLE